jgi:hypothetical protein
MTLPSLESQLLSLSQNEKTRAIQILARSLGNPWRGIQKTLCGFWLTLVISVLVNLNF